MISNRYFDAEIKYDADKEHIMNLFNVFDAAHNNTIAISDVGALLRVAGLPVKKSHVKPYLENWKEKMGSFFSLNHIYI